MDPLAAELTAITGREHVLTDPDLTAGYATDWTRRFHGVAHCVVRPGDTDQVARVLLACARHGLPVVPQGGNTGLVGGGVPPAGGAVVLSARRLRRLDPVDTLAAQVTAGAGRVRAQLRDRDPGARGHLRRQDVHRIEPAQPPGGEDHRTPGRRDSAADESGIAALRHHRRGVAAAGEQGPAYLTDVTRADHAACGAVEPAGPVRGVSGGDVGVGEHVLRAADRGQLGQQDVHEYSPYGPVLIYSAFQIRVRPFILGIHHGMAAEEEAGTVFR